LKTIILILLISCITFGDTIKIAVAANVSYAIKPLIKEFNKTNNTKVKVILGSSGKLTAQIKNGAPYDVFLSANIKYPDFLYKNNMTIKKPVVYTQGTLALFSAKKRNLQDLSIINNMRKIAIANPKTAPYGKAAYESITNAKLLDKNIKKLVYAENISQAVQFVIAAADVGFIAKSSLYSPKMNKYKKGENYIDVDKKLYKPINQAIALLNNKKSSLAFYEFILSSKAKKILKEYG